MLRRSLGLWVVFVCVLGLVFPVYASISSPKTGFEVRDTPVETDEAAPQEETGAEEPRVREKEEEEESPKPQEEENIPEEEPQPQEEGVVPHETMETADEPVEAIVEEEIVEEEALHSPAPPQGYKKGPWDLPVRLDSSVSIGKIYDFLNDPTKTKAGDNPQLNYEFKYFTHGAVTKAQKREKQGQYYVVNWGNDGAPANLVLRLDYRQTRTKDLVHTLEIPFSQVKGSQKGTFSITGDAYYKLGQVKSWRVSVVRNGIIVAQKKSFIW